MPGLGERALNPNTKYLVYEFSYNGRVFYVGHAHGEVRHAKRWEHVRNLVRHEQAGTLKPPKAKNLNTPSNRVIATLIKAGLPPHEVKVHWRGHGKAAAAAVEKERIHALVAAGAVLANIAGNPKKSSVAEVLSYIGAAHACPPKA